MDSSNDGARTTGEGSILIEFVSQGVPITPELREQARLRRFRRSDPGVSPPNTPPSDQPPVED